MIDNSLFQYKKELRKLAKLNNSKKKKPIIKNPKLKKELLLKKKKRKDYKSYISSNEWKLLKELIIEERGNYCEKCNNQFISLDLHHIHYDNFKKELRSDLLLLCRNCHNTIHDSKKYPPYI